MRDPSSRNKLALSVHVLLQIIGLHLICPCSEAHLTSVLDYSATAQSDLLGHIRLAELSDLAMHCGQGWLCRGAAVWKDVLSECLQIIVLLALTLTLTRQDVSWLSCRHQYLNSMGYISVPTPGAPS